MIATLLLTIAGTIPVEATTLDGVTVSGELTALTSQVATIDASGDLQALLVAELHELVLHQSKSVRRPAREVHLRDGSRMAVDEIECSSRQATISTTSCGTIEIPREFVSSIRLSRIDSKVESDWDVLLQRETRDDLVVVRKGDALDHVAGVVSGIDNDAVRLLLEGSPVPIPRERVFGVIFAGTNLRQSKVIGQLVTASGDRLAIIAIDLMDEDFTAKLASGPSVEIAADSVARIDFSLGKIVYLMDQEPAEVTYPTDHELFLLDVWRYRKGRNSYNDPLRVGHQVYERGLWIHSGTTLTYRLNREYRHLRADAGIASGIGESCQPTVGLIIRGDGGELLKHSISRGDDVRSIDVDVSGVRELEIEVTSTDPDGICEHLGLGDVRVIK